MLKNSIKTLSLGGAALALVATAAFAQTPSSTVNTTQTPATIGVTPQTANEANQKAVQRSDTATLVRTDDTAAQQARDAANRAQSNATPNTMSSTAPAAPAPRRAARADRN